MESFKLNIHVKQTMLPKLVTTLIILMSLNIFSQETENTKHFGFDRLN